MLTRCWDRQQKDLIVAKKWAMEKFDQSNLKLNESSIGNAPVSKYAMLFCISEQFPRIVDNLHIVLHNKYMSQDLRRKYFAYATIKHVLGRWLCLLQWRHMHKPYLYTGRHECKPRWQCVKSAIRAVANEKHQRKMKKMQEVAHAKT